MPRPIIFGEIPNIPEGYLFPNRKVMMEKSFHRNWAAGIDGNRNEGVAAIVLSGGYGDDKDYGSTIIYTGAGGNDPSTKKQIEHQSWKHGPNAGLLKSLNDKLPVRVIRGAKHKSSFSPKTGYQYAGLYFVEEAYMIEGRDGFNVCQYILRHENHPNEKIQESTSQEINLDYSIRQLKRKEVIVSRRVRDRQLSEDVKSLYEYKCQVCNTTIPTKNGFYAEGAHIKPIGSPHNGDDALGNLLCLCPNHHKMFDMGSLAIKDDYTLLGAVKGKLHVLERHMINSKNLSYHRKMHDFA
jgi:putative restriction endonuclease